MYFVYSVSLNVSCHTISLANGNQQMDTNFSFTAASKQLE